MPIHDWSRVEAGIFHDFHHAWIEEIKRDLNANCLPNNYYAMAEQHAAGFGPDVLALQEDRNTSNEDVGLTTSGGERTLVVDAPEVCLTAETDMEFYRRKQNTVVVRHVSGDRIVAIVEVVSKGTKSRRHGIRSLVEKAAALLD